MVSRAALDILVIRGGPSGERDVSLETGQACAHALQQRGHHVRMFDWAAESEATQFCRALDPRPDVVFNALHGTFGEDGRIGGLFECWGLPTTHSGTLASAIAMDKLMTKRLLEPCGIRFAESREIALSDSPLPIPYVLKPVAEGSSLGVQLVLAPDAIPKRDPTRRMMVEQYIPGREFTVGLLSGKALGVTEVVARVDGFYDYEAKYTQAKAARHIFPAALPSFLGPPLRAWAERAHRVLGCRSVSRCDFRYDPEQGAEGLYMLEINTHPGMTGMSLVPEQARGCGIEFETMIETIAFEALEEKGSA